MGRKDPLERFLEAANRKGLKPEVSLFPQGTHTAEQAAAAVRCPVGAIVKSLVFIADGTPILVLASGENRVDEAKLAKNLGASSVRKARAEEVKEVTGFPIGGVPPLGLSLPLRTVMDRDLFRHSRVWCAAGRPDAVFPTEPARLAEAVGAEVIELAADGET